MCAPEQRKYGSRCAIVFNGSPLFTGGAGSGESEIRRWIIENDWLETIVALPEQMFYNTGIGTFIWVVTNRKEDKRKGKIQLIDGRERWEPMRRSLGDKRRYLTDEIIEDLTRKHGRFANTETSKIFDNANFGFRRIIVERPLRLRFQITDQGKESFLDACPEFLDAVQAMEIALGTEPYDNWNTIWAQVQPMAGENYAKWTAANKKLFRQCFTYTDPEAQPVIDKQLKSMDDISPALFPGQKLPADLKPEMLNAICGVYPIKNGKKIKAVEYESDPALRDFENIPLEEDLSLFSAAKCSPLCPMPGSSGMPWTSRMAVSAR